MVDLLTVKRVLALDLGMSSEAIEAHLNSVSWSGADIAGTTEIPLPEALRIVASAEMLAATGT